MDPHPARQAVPRVEVGGLRGGAHGCGSAGRCEDGPPDGRGARRARRRAAVAIGGYGRSQHLRVRVRAVFPRAARPHVAAVTIRRRSKSFGTRLFCGRGASLPACPCRHVPIGCRLRRCPSGLHETQGERGGRWSSGSRAVASPSGCGAAGQCEGGGPPDGRGSRRGGAFRRDTFDRAANAKKKSEKLDKGDHSNRQARFFAVNVSSS